MKWCQARLCVPILDQIGATALYNVGPDYFDSVRKEYRNRKDALIEELKKYLESYTAILWERSM